MVRQAVVLAGGKGTRLAARLNGRPKPLIDVLGTPLLERQLLALKAAGFNRVVILVNHEADQIVRFCAQHDNFGLDLSILDDGEPRGTAGAVLHAWCHLEDDFAVVYGDTLFDLDFARFIAFHAEDATAAATLFLHPNDHPQDSDLVEIDAEGAITAFHPYPHPPGPWLPNMVNAALYLVRRDALAPWRAAMPPGLTDFAKDLFPDLLAAGGRLRGYVSPEYIKDIGTPSRLDQACHALESGKVARASLRTPQTAVFLDRDGTLNAPNGHITGPEQLEIFPFAPQAVRAFNLAGLRTVLVTNQPVLARGACNAADLARIHAKLETLLGQGGGFLDRIYYCPHHPDAGFPGEAAYLKIDCACRKPKPGLLLRAQTDLNIDLRASWMIGDGPPDIGAAAACGVTSVLVRTGGLEDTSPAEARSDFTFADLGAAARFITTAYPKLAERLRPLICGVAAGGDVFVAGQSRSGKTTLAGSFARELRLQGRKAVVISLDRWLRPDADQRPGVLGRFDLDAAVETFHAAALRRRGDTCRLELPIFSIQTRQRLESSTPVIFDPETIAIWEGVTGLAMAERLDLLKDCIFVETDEAGRKARVVAEYLRRGRTAAQSEQIYASRVEDEIIPLANGRELAGAVLSIDDLVAGSD